jgi:hypothetical protein
MPLLEQHPIGQIVPPMSERERSALRNDLVVMGLQVPIVLYEGKVLDGWGRYTLCVEEKIEPRFVDYEGNDPLGFVASLNLKRRHLTYEQKNEIAKKILEWRPERSDRSIAKEVGLSHDTVANLREEIGVSTAAEVIETKIEEAIAAEPGKSDRAIAKEVGASHPTVAKVRSGKNGDNRQNFQSDNRKLGRPKKAETQKEPKPLTSARDDAVNALAEQIGQNIDRLQDIVQIISGYDGVIQQKFTLGQRHELVRKFAKAMGVAFESRC